MADLQCLIGIQCAHFAIIAADQTKTASAIILLQNDVNKIYHINKKLILGLTGQQGSAEQVSQFVCKNIELYRMKNHYDLDIAAVVHFTGKALAEQLPMLNVLIAGYDDEVGGHLFYMDMLGFCVKVPFAVHGYAGLFCWSILERYYNPTLSVEEAYNILKICIREIQQRLIFSYPNFQVKVVSKDGIKEMPTISALSCQQ